MTPGSASASPFGPPHRARAGPGAQRLAWAARIELDLEYLDRQSAWLDLQLLVLTIKTAVAGSGVEGHPIDDPIAMPPTDDAGGSGSATDAGAASPAGRSGT